MTNEEIAEQLVRNHKDFKAEGFSEYMNGYLNGIILGLEYAQVKVKNLSSNTVLCDSVLPDYEYEMFFNSEPNEPMQIHGWYPIATDRIRHPEKIEQYIEKGLLRRITKDKTVA